MKKKRLNARRSCNPSPQQQETHPIEQVSPPSEPVCGELDAMSPKVELRLQGVVLSESSVVKSPMLPHVAMLVSLIEGIELSCNRIVELLRQAMRQHSIVYRTRTDYILRFLNQHPP